MKEEVILKLEIIVKKIKFYLSNNFKLAIKLNLDGYTFRLSTKKKNIWLIL